MLCRDAGIQGANGVGILWWWNNAPIRGNGTAMTTSDLPSLVDYRNNGKRPKPAFSAAEMQRRQDAIRAWMGQAKLAESDA